MNGAVAAWLLEYAVNAVWQVPVVAAAAWASAWLLRWAGPRVVHRVWVMALLVQVVLPGCAAPLQQWVAAAWGWTLGWGAGREGSVLAATGGARVLQGVALSGGWREASVAVYATAVLLLAVRLAWRVGRVRALARTVHPVALGGEALHRWEMCCVRFGLRGVVVGQSAAVRLPATLGWRRALLVLPEGMAETLNAEEMAAVLAHEAAHVARQDFAKNLLYEALTLPVAWHPALWFARERMVESREMVCDAMAARVTGGGVRFAESLLRLALLLVRSRPARVPHAIGIFDANTVERRIAMLTLEQVKVRGVRRALTVVACAVVGLGTCASALALRLEMRVAAGAVAGQAVAVAGPVRVSAGVMAGQVLTKATPKYPQEAKDGKISGAVVLKAVVDEAGLVKDLSVVSGPEALRQSSLDAVKQWTYKPYLLNGKPVAVETTVTVTYSFGR